MLCQLTATRYVVLFSKARFQTLPEYLQVRLAQLIWLHIENCNAQLAENFILMLKGNNWLEFIANSISLKTDKSSREKCTVFYKFSYDSINKLKGVLRENPQKKTCKLFQGIHSLPNS